MGTNNQGFSDSCKYLKNLMKEKYDPWYDSKRFHPIMNFGVKMDLYILFLLI